MKLPETIETERLTLRPLCAADEGPITMYASDRRVAGMLETMPHPYPPGAAKAFIRRCLAPDGAEHVWAMDATKIEGPEFIGVIGLRRAENALRLGYWVGPPFWRTGYASEAASAAVAAAQAAGCRRLEARVVAANEASVHVLVNAGFTEAGQGEFYVVANNGMTAHRLFTLDFAPGDA